ncbi:MAG TPA: hypothetical protein PKD55_23390, partial [Bellilinea sp.]|nr:hypothetical protein [Bellilinea sp.]
FAGEEAKTVGLLPHDLTCDTYKYEEALGDFDLTEDQADELLRTLFDIMRSFVELGVSVDVCGQILPDLFAGSDPAGLSDTLDNPNNQETRTPKSGKGAL